MGSSNAEPQDLTHRLLLCPRQRNSIWDESQHGKEQDHDQQHNNINADISMTGQKVEEVTSFKYLEATLCKNGTSAEVFIRIASAMARLNGIWRCNTISFAS